jgi:hypothetical protein
MDGILHRVTERTWEGKLYGYRVQVFWSGGGWSMVVINPLGHVEICPPVASLADGARRARGWVEEQLKCAGATGGVVEANGLSRCQGRRT